MKKSENLIVRISAKEKQFLVDIARQEEMSLSELIRYWGRSAAQARGLISPPVELVRDGAK